MNLGNKIPVFLVICWCLVTAPVVLPAPAGAQNSGEVVISGSVPLVIYDIAVTSSSPVTAVISWKTNGDADGTVEYGTTAGYGSLLTSGIMTKEHSLSLTGLQPGTVYHFRVISADLSGHRAASGDLTFHTHGPVPPGSYGWSGISADGDGGGTSNQTTVSPTSSVQPTQQATPGQPLQFTLPELQPPLLPGPEQPAGPTGSGDQLNASRNPGQSPGTVPVLSIPAALLQLVLSWWSANPLMAAAEAALFLAAVAALVFSIMWYRKKTP